MDDNNLIVVVRSGSIVVVRGGSIVVVRGGSIMVVSTTNHHEPPQSLIQNEIWYWILDSDWLNSGSHDIFLRILEKNYHEPPRTTTNHHEPPRTTTNHHETTTIEPLRSGGS